MLVFNPPDAFVSLRNVQAIILESRDVPCVKGPPPPHRTPLLHLPELDPNRRLRGLMWSDYTEGFVLNGAAGPQQFRERTGINRGQRSEHTCWGDQPLHGSLWASKDG